MKNKFIFRRFRQLLCRRNCRNWWNLCFAILTIGDVLELAGGAELADVFFGGFGRDVEVLGY